MGLSSFSNAHNFLKKFSMNLVLYPILKLLSRPVVCTNFKGLDTNTFFLLVRSIKVTVPAIESEKVTFVLSVRAKVTSHFC